MSMVCDVITVLILAVLAKCLIDVMFGDPTQERRERLARLRLQTAERFRDSDKSEVFRYAHEAMELAPNTDAARKARLLIEEIDPSGLGG